MQNFAAHIHGDLAGKVSLGDGGGHVGDVADLRRKVVRHQVDVVSEVLPGAGDAGDGGLAAQLALGAHFARHASDFGGEGIELVHHHVDRVLQFQNFAFDVHRDFAREVAAGDGGGHVGDVADLRREIVRHQVDVVGEVLPGAGDAGDGGLATEFAFGTHFAGHASDFGREGTELVHHDVDGLLELENFAAHIHGDLF